MNKASGGDGIPVELFQILKDDAMKVLNSGNSSRLFWWAPIALQMVIAAMKLKEAYSLEGKL